MGCHEEARGAREGAPGGIPADEEQRRAPAAPGLVATGLRGSLLDRRSSVASILSSG